MKDEIKQTLYFILHPSSFILSNAAIGQYVRIGFHKPAAQKSLGPRQTRHYRAKRQIHLFGNLSITKILEIVQNNRRPKRFRKLVEGLLQSFRIDLRQLGRQRLRKLADALNRDAVLLPVGPGTVQVGVAQNAEQPRLGSRRIAELAEMLLRLTERFLR